MAETTLSDNWNRGDAYEQYVGRWSRQVAAQFLPWLDVPAGRRWLDVGCGTGALCAAILDRCAPASVSGVDPSEGFLRTASQQLGERAVLLQGGATAIPLADASVDALVSGLVLNFVPGQRAALAEMARVVVPGGTIAAYVWDYGGGMELMRRFWDAAVELDPEAASLDEGARFPLCRPEALAALFASAGLSEIETRAIDVATDFASFDAYWQPFLGGQGPAPAYAMALSETGRARLRDRIQAAMPARPDGSIALTARAWAIRATNAAQANAPWPPEVSGSTADREFVHSRLIDAPPEQVFQAFSDPERLARWWGPDGFGSSIELFELRPGGRWRFVMHAPDGKHYPNESVFREVVEPRRIVFDHLSGHHFEMTISFTPQGAKTLVGWHQVFDTAAERERIAPYVTPANEQNLDRLQAEVLRVR